jgi:hypothetical protein
MTPERGKRWLFDHEIFNRLFKSGPISTSKLEDYIQSEIERNRKEAERDFAKKIRVKRCRFHCDIEVNEKIEAALKELDT